MAKRKRSGALNWIVKEAKRLRRKFPRRFATWKEYVAEASAIYASKHGGKSPVGKKRRRVGATKFIERGETTRSHSTKTYMRKRSKKGHFKGYKRIASITTPSQLHTDRNLIEANIQVGSIGSHKKAIRHHLTESLGKKLVRREMAKTKRERKKLTKDIRHLKSDLNKYC